MDSGLVLQQIVDNCYINEENALRVSGNISGSGETVVNIYIGSSGTSGKDGTSGKSGTSGIQGIQGSQGWDGWDGSNGTSGVTPLPVHGTSGSSGKNGSSGISGKQGIQGTGGSSGVDGSFLGSSGTSGSSEIPAWLLTDDMQFEFRYINNNDTFTIDLEPSYLYTLSAITLQSNGEVFVDVIHGNDLILRDLLSTNIKTTYFNETTITKELSISIRTNNATILKGKFKNKIIG